jgi:hypothetical protein
MADERIEIEASIDVTPSIAALKKLKQELRNTTDPAEFRRLQTQIDDTQESINSAKAGAGNFAEVLGTLPGPIGDIAGQAGGLIGTLKQFGQIKIEDLKSSFVDLGADIFDAAKGLANITGITKVYTVLNGFLAKSFVAVGISEAAAAAGARAFAAALITTGIGAIVVALGLLVNMLIQYAGAAERAAETQKKLNEQREKMNEESLAVETSSLKRSIDLLTSEARARGASQDEIFALEQQGRQLTLKAQERYLNELADKDSEEGRKTLEGIKNLQNEIKVADNNFKGEQLTAQKQFGDKSAELRKKELEQIKKNAKDAFLALMGDKDREVFLVEEKYTQQIQLATKYGEDTTLLVQSQQKELDAINTKYRQVEFDKEIKALELRNAKGEVAEEEYQKSLFDLAIKYNNDIQGAEIRYEAFKTEQRKKSAEANREILFMELQDQIDILDRANLALQGDFEQDNLRLQEKSLLLQQQRDLELEAAKNDAVKRLEIEKKYANELRAIDEEIVKNQQNSLLAREAAQLNFVSAVGNAVGALGGLFKKGSAAAKTAALAEIAIGTGVGFINALRIAQSSAAATGPGAALAFPIFYATQVAAVLSAASRAKAILSSGGSGSAGGGGGGSTPSTPSTPAPSFNAPRGMETPQIQSGTVGSTPQSQLAQSISVAQNRPIVAQVVSGAVSSQQALDRRTNGAATFGGG